MAAALDHEDEEEEDAFLRRFVVPEKDRHLYTSSPWTGGFRWFRSSNVVPLERERRRRQRRLMEG
jgi:hypothetical protein